LLCLWPVSGNPNFEDAIIVCQTVLENHETYFERQFGEAIKLAQWFGSFVLKGDQVVEWLSNILKGIGGSHCDVDLTFLVARRMRIQKKKFEGLEGGALVVDIAMMESGVRWRRRRRK
jgi:hypothetical protein